MLPLVLLTLFLANTAGAQQLPQNRTFRVAVDLVLINAAVIGPDGRAVTDLTAQDFVVREAEKEQQIAAFWAVTRPFHVILLVDASASAASKSELLKQAAFRFFDQLSSLDKVAIVEVGGDVRLIHRFTDDPARLRDSVRLIGSFPSRSTRLYDSIVWVLDEALRGVNDRKAIVVLTDACDNGSEANSDRMTESALKSDAVIYSLLVNTADDQISVLKGNLRYLSCVSLILSAGTPFAGSGVKQAAHSVVNLLPRRSRVSLYENRYCGILSRTLKCEFSRDQIHQAIESSEPCCDPKLQHRPRGDKPDGYRLAIGVTDSPGDHVVLMPSEMRETAHIISIGGLSSQRIEERMSQMLGNTPADADAIVKTLKEDAHYSRKIMAGVSDVSGGSSFDLTGLGELDKYFAAVARELRTTYTLGYYSTDSSPLLRSIEVRVKRPGCRIRARKAYLQK